MGFFGFGRNKRHEEDEYEDEYISRSNVGKKGRKFIDWLNENFAFNKQVIAEDTKTMLEVMSGGGGKKSVKARQRELQFIDGIVYHNASLNRFAVTLVTYVKGRQSATFNDGYPLSSEYANAYKLSESVYDTMVHIVELYNNRGWVCLTETQALAFNEQRQLIGEYIIKKNKRWEFIPMEGRNEKVH